jgi:FixJ family two-component response regulator
MSEVKQRVYVIDDDASVRRALARLIGAAGYDVKAFDSARAFLDDPPHPGDAGCLVLDVLLPELSGLELQRRLGEPGGQSDTLPIIFITGHGDIPMTVSAMKAGAADFLAKPIDERELLRAIEAAMARSEAALVRRVEIDEIHRRLERLTPREREVTALVVRGMLNKQVACELGTVEKTVKVHRARVMEKMEVQSLAELVRVWDKMGVG